MKRALALLALLLAAPFAAGAGTIDLDVRDATLVDVITLLSAQSGVNVVADESVRPERVTLHLHGVTFDEALAVLARTHGLQVRKEDGVLIVGAADVMNRRDDGDAGRLGAQTIVLALAHADPDDVSRELTGALPVGTVIVADKRTGSVVVSADAATIARARELVRALDAPGGGSANAGTRVYPLRYMSAADAAKLLKAALPNAVAVADDDRNALVVTGDERVQSSVASFLAKTDLAGAQVLFEVRVADVQPVDDSSDVGMAFGGVDLQGEPLAGGATYVFASGTLSLNARLSALVSQGRAQILATPKLLTLNNHEADLLIGETYPIEYQTSSFGGEEVQFVDVGVKLRLTPTIGPDGSVIADLHPEYSEVEGFSSNDLPIIASRKIDSTLRVTSGQTIVLGGLFSDVSSETVTKIPGLASIPVLGKFFQEKTTQHQRDEVVFLITPHVIYPGDPPPQK